MWWWRGVGVGLGVGGGGGEGRHKLETKSFTAAKSLHRGSTYTSAPQATGSRGSHASNTNHCRKKLGSSEVSVIKSYRCFKGRMGTAWCEDLKSIIFGQDLDYFSLGHAVRW